jgi:thiosulfate dehydrogenase [quinone] large subunit
MNNMNNPGLIGEPRLSKIIFADTRLAVFWLLVRLYVGWEWLNAGWGKVNNSAWVGEKAGTAIKGFLMGAVAKNQGAHPDVQGWYAAFLQNVAIPNATVFSYIVAFGEVAIGLGLIFGLFTGIAAFFGAFMNMNFLFAGTVSTNPLLFLFELFLILAWRTAGWIGLDRWALPALGTPWEPGHAWRRKS